MTTQVPLSKVPAGDIENLLDDAFGTERRARTAYLLRDGTQIISHLSFAIAEIGLVVATIQCWPVRVGDTPLILVGPVAVASAEQNRGLGRQLMRTMLAAIMPGDAAMVMIGDPEYYGHFGFTADATGGWSLPGPWEPKRLLLRNPMGVILPGTGLITPRL